eukprot:GEMP01007119.1.p1 GENE.GEMP01007119.1~~GEMP01007119.1.p1  ORF type:complete len:367 (+),score=56.21 GEMP01007119.1:191-1291(+)
MFIPEDMLGDVAARFPYEMCAAYRIVVVWDLLFSFLYVVFMTTIPPGETAVFCIFLWWWLWLPILFSIPGIFASFQALQFYEKVRCADLTKSTEYILNENCVRTVRLTWSLRKAFVAWNTTTLVLLMRPPVNNAENEAFLSAVWKLSVACAFWTALKKVLFALWFNRLSRNSQWSLPRIQRVAPAWTLKSSMMLNSLDHTCMVCLTPFFMDEVQKKITREYVRTLPCKCLKNKGRTYHVMCIDLWFQRRNATLSSAVCPVCNADIFAMSDSSAPTDGDTIDVARSSRDVNDDRVDGRPHRDLVDDRPLSVGVSSPLGNDELDDAQRRFPLATHEDDSDDNDDSDDAYRIGMRGRAVTLAPVYSEIL